MGLVQTLKLILDKGASAQLVADMRAAGAQSTTALQAEFKKKMGDIRHDMAAGLLTKEEAAKRGAEVAQAYNAAVIERIKALQSAGTLTTAEYNKLTASLKLAGKTSGEQASLASKAWGGFKNLVASIGPAIGAAFGVRAIIDFVKESVKGAAESESAWSELGVTLDNNGVKLDQAKREVGALATQIQRSTRFDDESVVRGFNTLLSLTGDYNKSLKAMGPIADFAAAKHLTFEDAAEKVGRAIEGNLRGLKQYIPTISKSSDVIAELGRFQGAAAADLDTFAGGVEHLKNMWGELQEHLGLAVIQALEGAGTFRALAAVVEDLTAWIDGNRLQVTRWTRAILDSATAAVGIIRSLSELDDKVARLQGSFDRLAFKSGAVFAGVARAVITAVAAMDEALSRFLRMLPGMGGVADVLLENAQDARSAAEFLGRFIEHQEKAIRDSYEYTSRIGQASSKELRDVRAGHAQGTVASERAAAAAGAAAHKKGADQAAAAQTSAARKTADVWKAAWDTSLAGFKRYGDAIEGGVKEQLGNLDDMIRDHDKQQFQAVKDSIAQTTKAQADGQEATRRAIVESGTVYTEVTDRMASESAAAAEQSSASWVDSLNLMVNSLQGLGKIAGGIFGGIVDSLSGIASGMSAVTGGLSAIGKAGGGVAGAIGKAAGAIGVVGGAIGVASTVIDLIGGLFKRDKDPNRLKTNKEEFQKAMAGDQDALNHLYQLSGRVQANVGWATDAAREDAYEAYLTALQNTPSLHPSGSNTRNLRNGSPSASPMMAAAAGVRPAFASGGPVRRTGLATLHEGESVFSSTATLRLGGQERLAALNALLTAGQNPAGRGGGDFIVNIGGIALNGVADRDVPRRVVESIKQSIGQDYQKHAALQGNAALP